MDAVFTPQNIFSLQGKGLVIVGQVSEGVLKVGMEAKLASKKVIVSKIEAFGKVSASSTGQNSSVGVTLDGISQEEMQKQIGSPMNFSTPSEDKK